MRRIRKSARYWFDYIFNAPRRRRLHRQRSQEIIRMKFRPSHVARLLHESIASQYSCLRRQLRVRGTSFHRISGAGD